MTPAEILPPRLAARIRVEGPHWFLRPAPDGRARPGAVIGATNSKGYALVGVPGQPGKNQLLSRLVLTAADRPPRPGEQACHNDSRCSWRHCVAPDCLRWDTAAANAQDACRKRLARQEGAAA